MHACRRSSTVLRTEHRIHLRSTNPIESTFAGAWSVAGSMRRLSGNVGIDVFSPPLHGLVLAEAEFSMDEQARSFRSPLEP